MSRRLAGASLWLMAGQAIGVWSMSDGPTLFIAGVVMFLFGLYILCLGDKP